MRRTRFAVVAGALVASCAGTLHAEPQYSMMPFDVSYGTNRANWVTPYDVNASGQVAGSAGFLGQSVAVAGFYTDPKVGQTNLVDPIWGGIPTQATQAWFHGINDQGVSVGWSYVDGPFIVESHVVAYSNGVLTDLGTLGGSAGTASGINNNGVIVGQSSLASGGGRAFVYQNGTMSNLGLLPGGQYSEANAINDAGVIVGFGTTTSDIQIGHAIKWIDGQMTDMGALESYQRTYATAISESGYIVGSADNTDSMPTPSVAWIDDGTGMEDIGYLFVNDNGVRRGMWAKGVNSFGDVVGYTYDKFSRRTAFLYQDGQLYNLEDYLPAEYAGWELWNAFSINDEGWIAGCGFAPGDSHLQGFALRLVPEPGSLSLLVLGGFLAVRRRVA